MKANELYEFQGDKIQRKRKFCPKCEGSFMAEHSDRLSCGNCGYTEFKNKPFCLTRSIASSAAPG